VKKIHKRRKIIQNIRETLHRQLTREGNFTKINLIRMNMMKRGYYTMEWLSILDKLPQLQEFLLFLSKNPLAMVGLVILIAGVILNRYVQLQGAKKAKVQQQTDTPQPVPSESATSSRPTEPFETVASPQSSSNSQSTSPSVAPSQSPEPVEVTAESSRSSQASTPPTLAPASPSAQTMAPMQNQNSGTVNNTVNIGGRKNKVGNITQGGKINDK
jgi:cytoskeletal protein RodZ